MYFFFHDDCIGFDSVRKKNYCKQSTRINLRLFCCMCVCVFASRLNPLWPLRVISISMIFQRNWNNSYRFPSTFFSLFFFFLCSVCLSITLFCTILYSFSFSLFVFLLRFVVQDVLNESSMLTSIRTKFTGMQDTDKDSNGLSFIPLLTNSSCFSFFIVVDNGLSFFSAEAFRSRLLQIYFCYQQL